MDGNRSGLSRLLVIAGLALLSGCRTYSEKTLTVPQSTYLQHPPQYAPPQETVRAQSPAPPLQLRQAIDTSNLVCKAYSLSDVDDPKLCKWIAATIPQMIQPDSWSRDTGKLTYHASSKVLVVNQTPAVHARIAEFLDSLKNVTPQPVIAQARHLARESKTALPTNQTTPKHLFHLIIRNEGDGVIDVNLEKLAEWQSVPLLVNQYSSDPNVRMEQSLIDSENLRQMHDEWRRPWMNDQPSHMTPGRIESSVSQSPEKISVPRMPPAD